jgi:hypothetical protein
MKDKIFEYMKKGYFFRYQDPKFINDLSQESKSWGMIYGSEEEALEDGSEVLEGKSCMTNPYQLWTGWGEYFQEDDVIMVFDGEDTGTIGHDEENVATFTSFIDAFNKEEIENFLYDNFEDFEDFQKKYWDYKYR